MRKILNLIGKKGRKRQVTQTYSPLYYELKLKDIIAERWDAYTSDIGKEGAKSLSTSPPLWFCNKLTKELYDEESDKVKKEVEKVRGEESGAVKEGDNEDDINEQELKCCAQAQAYQRCYPCFSNFYGGLKPK